MFCDSSPTVPWVGLRCVIVVYSEKQLKDIKNSFDFITFGIIILNQILFVIDRIITMQFTNRHIEIHGPLVTIQY